MTPPGDSIFSRAARTGVPLLIARLVLGGLFIWMGYNKVTHPTADFLKAVRQYHALPETPPFFLNASAIVLPWLELICGFALLLGFKLRGAAATIGLMLAVFTPAIFLRAMAVSAADGTPFMQIAFDCGCGAGEVVIWKKLLENSALFLVAMFVLFSKTRRFCLESDGCSGRLDPEVTPATANTV